MDSPQRTQEQVAVETVGISERISTKEGKNVFVSQRSHGDSLLRCTCNSPHRLP